MNRVCGTNSTSRRFISGRVLTILAMLAAALASHGPDPLVFSAGRQQQPQLPTVFIIGDSTVKTPTEGQQGWGDPIADLFDQTRIKVENHARGGRSSRTFQTEGLWDQILAQMKPGDFVLMQFGHNDGGAINDTSRARGSLRGVGEETEEIDNLLTKKHEVVHTYGWYMRKFVTDTKAKGAIPIVLSPIPRNIWKDGKVVRAVATYGGWAAEVAKSQGACFVDLNEIVAKQYEVMGPEKVKEYFPTDHTHTNPLGARLNAEAVASGLRGLKNCSLAAFLLKHTEIKHKNDPTNSHEMALRIGSASKGCGTGKRLCHRL
jgi:rhamnogalacturonan acetylesterase